jgi:hypothetical protein
MLMHVAYQVPSRKRAGDQGDHRGVEGVAAIAAPAVGVFHPHPTAADPHGELFDPIEPIHETSRLTSME